MRSSHTALLSQPVAVSAAIEPPSPRPRFAMLDGLRGLAALYVVLYHAVDYTGHTSAIGEELSLAGQILAGLLAYGAYAVPVFIVLSGFSLMLPLAQRGIAHIPDGAANYLRRRAWRILPAYYAALALSLGLISLFPVMQLPAQTAWDSAIPVTPEALISHLLLVHDLSSQWIYTINSPMWSVAVEWQIYFLFPLVLLPILRRSNTAVTLGAAMLLGMAPHLLIRRGENLDSAHPWFIGLFAMGMVAAIYTYSSDSRIRAYLVKYSRLCAALGLALGLAVALAVVIAPEWMHTHRYISEPIVGLVVASVLFRYAHAARAGGRRSLGHRLLESRPLMKLGDCSYSIYLLHLPILALINLWTLSWPLSPDLRLTMMVGVGTSIAVLCAYGFYLLIERRFLQIKERQQVKAQALAAG